MSKTRDQAKRLGPALLCAILAAGCAGTMPEPGELRLPTDLPPPRLVDESLTCEVLEEPEIIHREQPDYPVEARQRPRSGEVVIKVIITRDGTIRDPQVVRASHPMFIDPVLTVLERWRYRPASCDGVPVEMVFHVYSQFDIY